MAWPTRLARCQQIRCTDCCLSCGARSIGRRAATWSAAMSPYCASRRGVLREAVEVVDLGQADAVSAAAAGTSMHAYVVRSLLTSARTEELRALTWSHLDLDGDPPTIELWHSVRAGGDAKTKRSRRTLELADRSVEVLRLHRREQVETRFRAGVSWQDLDLVFSTQAGTELDAANVRRAFRRVVAAAGLDPQTWTPRELRHPFVSLLSSSGVPIEGISLLVGHASTVVTEKVYRKSCARSLPRRRGQ